MTELGLRLSEVRELLGEGEIHGDPDFVCRSVAMLDQAGPDQLAFVRDRQWAGRAAASRAGALLVAEPVAGFTGHQLVVASPHRSFARVLEVVARRMREQPSGLHPAAVIDPAASLGEDVRVGPGAVVRAGAAVGDRSVLYANAYVGERSRLGADCVLYPGVIVMEDVTLGDRVVVQPGAVIGAEGYGYVQEDGRHRKVPQVGGVRIGDDVEIGALATIDRATLGRTSVGRGSKIGDLVHVAHNCAIGEDVLLLPTVAVSGSVTIGDRALLAGRAGIADNLTIGEGAILGGTAVAFKDVPAGARMWGNPARDKGLEMRVQALLGRLPELFRRVRELEKKLAD